MTQIAHHISLKRISVIYNRIGWFTAICGIITTFLMMAFWVCFHIFEMKPNIENTDADVVDFMLISVNFWSIVTFTVFWVGGAAGLFFLSEASAWFIRIEDKLSALIGSNVSISTNLTEKETTKPRPVEKTDRSLEETMKPAETINFDEFFNETVAQIGGASMVAEVSTAKVVSYCPSCNATVKYNPKDMGKPVDCPKCRQSFRLGKS